MKFELRKTSGKPIEDCVLNVEKSVNEFDEEVSFVDIENITDVIKLIEEYKNPIIMSYDKIMEEGYLEIYDDYRE